MARIMIVEDSKVYRKIIGDMLIKNGHTIAGEAHSGEEALSMYREVLPDLVTMDIIMPGMDGVECLRELKEMHTDAKVVMVTSVKESATMLEALKIGCLDFLTKPMEEDDLIRTIEKYV